MYDSNENKLLSEQAETLKHLHETQAVLEETTIKLDALVNNIPGGIAVLQVSDRIKTLYFNDTLPSIAGYNKDEYINIFQEDLTPLIYFNDLSAVLNEINNSLYYNKSINHAFRLNKKEGGVSWVRLSASWIKNHTGINNLYAVFIDINNEKTIEDKMAEVNKQMQFRVYHDSLTGIYNKDAFYELTYNMINKANNTQYSLIYFNVERFKVINDLYGKYAGDIILKDIAQHLTTNIKDKGTYGRISGDHFAACILKSAINIDDIANIFNTSYIVNDVIIDIVVNVGIYDIVDVNMSIDQMCDRAGLAVQSIKGNYLIRYAYYDESMRRKLIEEQEIVYDMSKALNDKQFDIFLQPQYNHSSGKIIGAEALVRWFHPQKGMISPATFIPIFEKNGFISKIDEYVWERACQILRSQIDRNHTYVPISVNISRIDLYNPNFDSILLGLLKQYSVPVSLLRLEITESSYMDNPQQLIEAVKKLQSYGFFVEMDDFGSGYSSLNTLKDVPVDMLKLDLKFLSGTDNKDRGGNILNSIVRMSRWLKLTVLAEGVETQKQADYLKSIGCDLVQGYLYSRPLPLEEYEKILSETETGLTFGCRNPSGLVDFNEFWNPDAQTTLIFNCFVGAAGVFEYDGISLETLRVNDKFYETLNISSDTYYLHITNILELLFYEDKLIFIDKLEEAINTKSEVEVECRWIALNKSTNYMWLKVKMRMIAEGLPNCALYVAIEKVTERKSIV